MLPVYVLATTVWDFEETNFEPSNKETINHEFGVAGHSILQQSEDTPSYIKERYSPMYWDAGKQKKEGNLAKHSTRDIDRLEMY